MSLKHFHQANFNKKNLVRYRRVVTYTADDHHGFQANVQREPWTGEGGHKYAQPVLTKVIQPATITKVIQPAVAVQKVVAAPISHGWQQPQAAWKPAPQHGWQANPHANPWG